MVENHKLFVTHMYLIPPLTVLALEFCSADSIQKTRIMALYEVVKSLMTCTAVCYRRTDRPPEFPYTVPVLHFAVPTRDKNDNNVQTHYVGFCYSLPIV